MSGTIVGICTAVLFAHDGSTAGDHPVGWVVIPSTDVHVGWLYSTCIIYWVGFAHPVPLYLCLWPAVRGL